MKKPATLRHPLGTQLLEENVVASLGGKAKIRSSDGWASGEGIKGFGRDKMDAGSRLSCLSSKRRARSVA